LFKYVLTCLALPKKMKHQVGFWGLVLAIVFRCSLGQAQDSQLSQYYAVPTLVSPAFAGIQGSSRVNFIHRNQWPNLDANFKYSAFTADLGLGEYNSGVGISLSNDSQFANLNATSLALNYAYHMTMSEDATLSVGLQGAYVNRSLGRQGLVWGSQLESLLLGTGMGSADPISRTLLNNRNYLDLGAGILVNTKYSWFGLTANHLNRPDRSLVGLNEERLPSKFSLIMGTKIFLEEPYYDPNSNQAKNTEKSFSPVLHYKRQGPFDQLDLGAYVTYAPLVAGLWYRGIPVQKKSTHPYAPREAIVALLGYRKDNFSLGYSYDLSISSLGPSSGGAHEISLAYVFDFKLFEKKPVSNYKRLKRVLACPKF